MNMPPRWGFSSFKGGRGYNDSAPPPELKNGRSAAAPTTALTQSSDPALLQSNGESVRRRVPGKGALRHPESVLPLWALE